MRFVSQDWVVPCALLLLVSCTTATALGKPENKITTSVFLSPKIELGPGSVANKYFFDAEFPRGHIAIKSFNAELVDEEGKSVPLHEVYLHHWVVVRYHQPKNVSQNHNNINQTDNIVFDKISGFCQDNVLSQYFGLGSETRGTATDIPDPFGIQVGNHSEIPYGYDEKWLINVHAIDTRGVEDRLGCTECRCDLYNVTKDENGNPLSPDYKGGLDCCPDNSTCRLNKGFKGPNRTIYLKYTVKWFSWHNYVVPLKIYILDVTDVLNVSKGMSPKHNCKIEYQVEACSKGYKNSSVCIDVKKTSFPMQTGGYLIYGYGHQHTGGIATTLYGQDGVICSSIPKYGSGSKAGNEKGYIVGMSTCYPRPGTIQIRDGETLTLEISYNNSIMHSGVMGLFYILVAEKLPHL